MQHRNKSARQAGRRRRTQFNENAFSLWLFVNIAI